MQIGVSPIWFFYRYTTLFSSVGLETWKVVKVSIESNKTAKIEFVGWVE
jgi:hypothetical protein